MKIFIILFVVAIIFYLLGRYDYKNEQDTKERLGFYLRGYLRGKK